MDKPWSFVDDEGNKQYVRLGINSADTDYDAMQYDFASHVWQILPKKLPKENRRNAIATQDFRAFLADSLIPAPKELSTLRDFGSVAADILKPLGECAKFAERLRQGAGDMPSSSIKSGVTKRKL